MTFPDLTDRTGLYTGVSGSSVGTVPYSLGLSVYKIEPHRTVLLWVTRPGVYGGMSTPLDLSLSPYSVGTLR